MKHLIYLFVLLSCGIVFSQDCQIPNGNFEVWKNGDKALHWAGSNMAGVEGGANAMAGYDFRNTFRTPGKVGYGLHIKNVSIADMLAEKKPQEWARLPEQYKKMIRESAFSGYVFSCQSGCEGNIMAQNEGAVLQDMFFPIQPTFGALCGYYKANFKKGDKAWVNTFVTTKNPTQVAGAVRPGESSAVMLTSTTQWTPFKIPIYFFEGLEPSKMFIQLYLVGSGFPNGQPTGMNPVQMAMEFKSSDGSEVFFDELCLCDEPKFVDTSDPAFQNFEIPTSTDPNDDDDDSDPDETIFIAPNGSDAGSGSRTNPFASLKKAIQVAQGKRIQGKSVTIVVKDGTYRQEANVDLGVTTNLPTLKIEAENTHQAIFEGAEPINSSISWSDMGNGLYRASGPLHPDQKPVIDYSDPSTFNAMDAKVPAVIVNGIAYTPATNIQQTSNSYIFSPQMVMVNPAGSNLNSAQVRVSVREYAVNVGNGGNVIVSGLRIKGYPISQYPQTNPDGISGLMGVTPRNCIFE